MQPPNLVVQSRNTTASSFNPIHGSSRREIHRDRSNGHLLSVAASQSELAHLQRQGLGSPHSMVDRPVIIDIPPLSAEEPLIQLSTPPASSQQPLIRLKDCSHEPSLLEQRGRHQHDLNSTSVMHSVMEPFVDVGASHTAGSSEPHLRPGLRRSRTKVILLTLIAISRKAYSSVRHRYQQCRSTMGHFNTQ